MSPSVTSSGVVDLRPNHFQGMAPGVATAIPSAIGAALHMMRALMASYMAGNRSVCTPIFHRRAAVPLPRHHASETSRHHHGDHQAFQPRHVFQHFQRDGPCLAATASSS